MEKLLGVLIADLGPYGVLIIVMIVLHYLQNNKLNRILSDQKDILTQIYVSLEKKVPFEWAEKEHEKFRSKSTCESIHKDHKK